MRSRRCIFALTCLVNRAGEKLSPLEIDAALLSVEGVNEAVSFGVPDEMYGEKVRPKTRSL